MKTLIVYGTRYGTAAEIAEEIGKTIENKGIEVDLIDSRSTKNYDISHYDMVIVGSGIKIGKWTKGSLKFLEDNKSALSDKKVALFVTCGAANMEETIAEGQEKYLDEVAEKYLSNKPVAMGLFGSIYDPNAKHGLMYKLATKFIIKKGLDKQGINTSKRIDYRDWDEIRTWAFNLANMLE
ncbi:flavodoxin domain-containing protein [Methanobacterium sp.]|uniref:flavodoxin domain-containing protein n=1 Tax=Methanobacterium sp. TaxID=2164 RepID=UPI003C795818